MARLVYTEAPGDILWSQALFDGIQATKAGTFDFSEAYQQFSFLFLPHMTVPGAHGASVVMGFYKIDNGGVIAWPGGTYDVGEVPTNHIIQMGLVELVNDVPVIGNLVRFDPVDVTFGQLFRATSVNALETVIFRGDDGIGFNPAIRDQTNDLLRGWGGNDSIYLTNSGGTDRVYGGNGDDLLTVRDGTASVPLPGDLAVLYGGNGKDTLEGDEGAERLYGGNGDDVVGQFGFGGDDSLYGGSGKDTLQAGNGADVLDGGDGDDALRGGQGADILTGGAGADLFLFVYIEAQGIYDSGANLAGRDVITDFVSGLDHFRIVHNVLPQVPLQIIANAPFTAAHQVRWSSHGGTTTVFVNTDADLKPEMAITLQGTASLLATDFL